MKYYRQLDETDCGPACLAMIASHYGLIKSLTAIRQMCGTDSTGTNLMGLMTAAQKIGFAVKPLRGQVQNETFDAKLLLPFIAHVKIPTGYFDSDHYVVVKKITKKEMEIWDPAPGRGVYRIDRTKFIALWTGYVVFLAPDANFKPAKEKGNILFKFLPLLFPYKKQFILVTLASFLIIIIGILVSFYFKYVIDEVVFAKSEFTLTALSVILIFLVIMQTIIDSFRSILISHFSYKADLRLNFSYIAHVLKLPIAFFDSRKTGEILSRLGDIGKIREALSGAAISVIMDTMLLIAVGPVLFSINPVLFALSGVTVLVISVIVFFSQRYSAGIIPV
jgi:ATP-binding cassette subfamily B protein